MLHKRWFITIALRGGLQIVEWDRRLTFIVYGFVPFEFYATCIFYKLKISFTLEVNLMVESNSAVKLLNFPAWAHLTAQH